MSGGSCRKQWQTVLTAVGGLALMALVQSPVSAQTPSTSGTNSGAIHFTGGVDVPSVYVFRGLLQEVSPQMTLWPSGDIGIALASGDGGLKSVSVNVGVWESLQTGSSGTNGPSAHAHYEEDFYTTLTLGFGGGLHVATSYMALTSPNQMWNTVKELQFKVARAGSLNPYGFLALELTKDGQADAGARKGTYLELGVGPAFPLGKANATLTVPVKVGLSLKDYYELRGKDNKFGYLDVGGLVTVPLGGVPGRFGMWNVHGGADVLVLGATTEAWNVDKNLDSSKTKIVALVGLGVWY